MINAIFYVNNDPVIFVEVNFRVVHIIILKSRKIGRYRVKAFCKNVYFTIKSYPTEQDFKIINVTINAPNILAKGFKLVFSIWKERGATFWTTNIRFANRNRIDIRYYFFIDIRECKDLSSRTHFL